LSRLCNAKVRIGFSRHPKRPAPYLTESVALPDKSENEHRIETLLRLLSPFGLVRTTNWALELGLRLPASAVAFAAETLENRPFILAERFVLINFSAIRHGLREEDIIVLLRRLLTTTPLAVGLLAEMDDQQTSREIAMVLASDRVATVDPMTPIETAALISKADALLTGGDIPAHLASAVDTPAVILWTRGDFDRTHSRSARHVFLRAAPKQTVFELEQVWQALQPMLTLRKSDVEDQWEGLLHQPRDSDDPSP
jgi:ADP-heptose:LPS heptosyltransferase